MSESSLLSTKTTEQIEVDHLDPHRGDEPSSDEEERRMPWKRLFLWMGIAVIGMFFFLLLLDKVIMPWYVKLGAEAQVPAVVGMPYPEAEKLLKEKGFEVKRAEPRYNHKYPAGTVLMQLPYGGAVTKEGRRIYLTESRGVEMIPLPNVVGRPLREARITLMRQGFDIGEIEYDYNDTIMRDLIFSQSIPPKVGARPGTDIDLFISRGPTTRYTMMPNLVGLSLDEARSRLGRAGLTFGVVRKRRSEFDRNIVIEQSASPYSQVAEQAAINVTISDPNAPVVEPVEEKPDPDPESEPVEENNEGEEDKEKSTDVEEG